MDVGAPRRRARDSRSSHTLKRAHPTTKHGKIRRRTKPQDHEDQLPLPPQIQNHPCLLQKPTPPPSPIPGHVALLDRLREAVFRLIMLSALSKATQESNPSSGASDHHHRSCYDSVHDPRHSEAVAECIEFIKKSATVDEIRDSSEVVLPVTVM
ncbi:transducin/WD40 repeat-like superfamily protein [Actinidia rufa]|uniref:Transducin/WD40 repeat-like superfamily protein n=1 Tax=Actinidia rufa TaxID=165716 RepID=A0A7J0EPE9_9ERIC|nr:transducin/WD40 repeat-like superfamily protein [Actinidia rufa]